MSATINLPAEIFKAYDIRGIVGKSLTAEVVRRIGHALSLIHISEPTRPY